MLSHLRIYMNLFGRMLQSFFSGVMKLRSTQAGVVLDKRRIKSNLEKSRSQEVFRLFTIFFAVRTFQDC